jgi:hypothetical protein
MAVQRLAYTTDLIDEEWRIPAPLLPPEKAGRRYRKYPMGEVLNGIRRGSAGWHGLSKQPLVGKP